MPAADLSPYFQAAGTVADGTKFDNMLAEVQTLLNGLDASNFAAGQIFDPAKLQEGGAADGDCLVYDSANARWTPASSRKLLASSLDGYPGDGTKFLAGDGSWKTLTGALSGSAGNPLVSVANTAAETDAFGAAGSGVVIPGGTLGTKKQLRLTLIGDVLNNTGLTANGPTWKLYYGGTVAASGPFSYPTGTNRYSFVLRGYVSALNATNAQALSGRVDSDSNSDAAIPVASAGGVTVAAVDATVNQNLRVTFTLSTASANLAVRIYSAIVELHG